MLPVLYFVNGEPIDYQQREIRQRQGQIGSEFAITYRANLEENETVTSGAWWANGGTADVPEVSVEEGMAETLKVTPGDSISFADFPTEAIGETTRAYRQLGIGYANLGALLMATGHGYDSEGGRALATTITSLMTGATRSTCTPPTSIGAERLPAASSSSTRATCSVPEIRPRATPLGAVQS